MEEEPPRVRRGFSLKDLMAAPYIPPFLSLQVPNNTMYFPSQIYIIPQGLMPTPAQKKEFTKTPQGLNIPVLPNPFHGSHFSAFLGQSAEGILYTSLSLDQALIVHLEEFISFVLKDPDDIDMANSVRQDFRDLRAYIHQKYTQFLPLEIPKAFELIVTPSLQFQFDSLHDLEDDLQGSQEEDTPGEGTEEIFLGKRDEFSDRTSAVYSNLMNSTIKKGTNSIQESFGPNMHFHLLEKTKSKSKKKT